MPLLDRFDVDLRADGVGNEALLVGQVVKLVLSTRTDIQAG